MREFKGSKMLSLYDTTMDKSRDPEELQYYWEQWREQSGKKMIDLFKQYIDLYNEKAKLNGLRYCLENGL